MAFRIALTEYADILPEVWSKISKLKFALATCNFTVAFGRILDNGLARMITAKQVYSLIYIATGTDFVSSINILEEITPCA